MKNLFFVLFASFLIFFSFNSIGITKASAEAPEDQNTLVAELEKDEILQPLCLTCGGTTTKNYVVTSTTRSVGLWKDSLRPYINGGPAGGSKTYTESETYTASYSSSIGANLGAISSLVGYGASYSKSFTESQAFNLEKNKKYKLISRPTYEVKRVRYSVYNMQNGGKQTFKEYKYVTTKKPIGMEIDLVEVR